MDDVRFRSQKQYALHKKITSPCANNSPLHAFSHIQTDTSKKVIEKRYYDYTTPNMTTRAKENNETEKKNALQIDMNKRWLG